MVDDRRAAAEGSVLLVRPADAVDSPARGPSPPPYSLDANIADSSNEWLVQCENGRYRYNYLTMAVRSMDLEFSRTRAFRDGRRTAAVWDPGGHARRRHIRSRQARLSLPLHYDVGAAHVRSSARYPTNDIWTKFKIPLQTECAPYPCFRVVSVKAVGAVSVGLIRLTEPE